MKEIKHKLSLNIICYSLFLFFGVSQGISKEILLNEGWKFSLSDRQEYRDKEFQDENWRLVNLPHDWSIEPRFGNNSPFTRTDPGGVAVGHTEGGTAWYRKTFKLLPEDANKQILLYFEGVSRETKVMVNGEQTFENKNAYTSFYMDVTRHCTFDGKENILAVRVSNEGQTERWYSGSGIYRNVRMQILPKVSIEPWGIFVTNSQINDSLAKVHFDIEVNNHYNHKRRENIEIQILNHKKEVVAQIQTILHLVEGENKLTKELYVNNPSFWDLLSPYLYTARILLSSDKEFEDYFVPFGIRRISFDSEHGFRLNGRSVLLKGGCLHHDNGLLGAAAFDRAEERKVELLLAQGFNAVRCAHNPPSEKFLETCDRLGMLVIDEAFDQWIKAKNPDDYHRHFEAYSGRDLASMVRRDRNHPSIIMWSIGNEIPERATEEGVEIARSLKSIVQKYDTTRPVTAAINEFWDNPELNWKDSEAAFAPLDIAGYNYMWYEYRNDHLLFPKRVVYGSESVAKEAAINWKFVEEFPFLIGDFVWTAIDYLGESGIGNNYLIKEEVEDKKQFMEYPWFNGNCGDLDICGNKKPQSYYRDVIWGQKPLAILVNRNIPKGYKEKVSYWGWPEQSRTWKGDSIIRVSIYSRADSVEVFLNNRFFGVGKPDTLFSTNFKIPYEEGELKAVAWKDGKSIGTDCLYSVEQASQILVETDRRILNEFNDLAFITVTLTDEKDRPITDSEQRIQFECKGAGRVIASGNACPYDMESFHSLEPKIYKGKTQLIIQPFKPGVIELKVKSGELEASLSLKVAAGKTLE